MSFEMIANGSQFARTSARAAKSFPSEAKDERRLKGNYRAKGHQVFRVACGGVYTYIGGGGRGGATWMRTWRTRRIRGAGLIHF